MKKKTTTGYQGITYKPQWKSDCKNGIHLFDECWNNESHYLVCDDCQLMVHIKDIEITYLSPDKLQIIKLKELLKRAEKFIDCRDCAIRPGSVLCSRCEPTKLGNEIEKELNN